MRNHKFVAHTTEDLLRLGGIGDQEAILEIGVRVLEDDFYLEESKNHDCNNHCDCPTEVTCPDCDNEFEI